MIKAYIKNDKDEYKFFQEKFAYFFNNSSLSVDEQFEFMKETEANIYVKKLNQEKNN